MFLFPQMLSFIIVSFSFLSFSIFLLSAHLFTITFHFCRFSPFLCKQIKKAKKSTRIEPKRLTLRHNNTLTSTPTLKRNHPTTLRSIQPDLVQTHKASSYRPHSWWAGIVRLGKSKSMFCGRWVTLPFPL